jgi:hypothetical protein
MAEPRYGFMCQTDFDWELGEACGGTEVYCSEADLRHERKCVDSCGIVKVKIELVEIVQPENRDWGKNESTNSDPESTDR